MQPTSATPATSPASPATCARSSTAWSSGSQASASRTARHAPTEPQQAADTQVPSGGLFEHLFVQSQSQIGAFGNKLLHFIKPVCLGLFVCLVCLGGVDILRCVFYTG